MREMEETRRERMKLESLADQGLPSISELDEKAAKIATPQPRRSIMPIAVVAAIILVAAAIWWMTNKPAATKPKKPAIPVTVETVQSMTMPLEIHTIGNVTPMSSVAIKSRIGGHIVALNFKEGETVTKGQLLFRIDSGPLQSAVNEAQANILKQRAVVKQAQAQSAKDRANLAQSVASKAKDTAQQRMWARQINRYKMLAAQGAVSQENYDQVRSSHEASEATVTADDAQIENAKASLSADDASEQNARGQLAAAEAQLENAKMQLNYTAITAPITGRTGSVQGFVGNIVKPDDNTLVIINQVSPIYVAFSVPEQALEQIRRYQHGGQLSVTAFPPGSENSISTGFLTFSENTVDMQTGTIKLKATFPNVDDKLWPGQFVNVNMHLTDEANATTIPSNAVQEGQKGQFVFVLNPADMTVSVQPITVVRTVGPRSIVSAGLTPGQQVITDGQMQLSAGTKIKLKTRDAGPASPEAKGH